MTAEIAPPPGPHGGDGARLAETLGIPFDEVLDLSASVNPFAPDVVGLVREHADAVTHYPEPTTATAALATAMSVDPDRLVLTNGGAEAIALVAAEYPVGYVEEPDFSLYARHLCRIETGAPRWRSNPHNPTGRLAERGERAAVWDEAFYPLATGCWTRGDDAVVIGSLTKLFACPGLRAGYVLVPHPSVASRVRARQPEWSVNALACAVLPELLAATEIETWARRLAGLRRELVGVLSAAGLVTDPSDAPFVLVREAHGVREHLARSAVLVRDTSSFGFPDGVRVAVPSPAGLERFAGALEQWKP